MNVEKIINEIAEKMIELKKAVRFTGLNFECHDKDNRVYGFLHEKKGCIYCMNKERLIDVLKRKEILFRKF